MNKIVLAKKNIHLNKQNLEKFKNSRDEINKAVSGIQKQKMMDFIKNNEGYAIYGFSYNDPLLVVLNQQGELDFLDIKTGDKRINFSSVFQMEALATYNVQYQKTEEYLYFSDDFAHAYRLNKDVLAKHLRYLGDGDFDHLTDDEFSKTEFFNDYVSDNLIDLTHDFSGYLEMITKFDQSGDFLKLSISKSVLGDGVSLGINEA